MREGKMNSGLHANEGIWSGRKIWLVNEIAVKWR